MSERERRLRLLYANNSHFRTIVENLRGFCRELPLLRVLDAIELLCYEEGILGVWTPKLTQPCDVCGQLGGHHWNCQRALWTIPIPDLPGPPHPWLHLRCHGKQIAFDPAAPGDPTDRMPPIPDHVLPARP